MEIKITERGWAGHFCGAFACKFRRNTLIEYGDERIVVSTVGSYWYRNKVEVLGSDRYYETMAFPAIKEGVYWEADIKAGELSFNSRWGIDFINEKTDALANDMHENVVSEFINVLKEGLPYKNE